MGLVSPDPSVKNAAMKTFPRLAGVLLALTLLPSLASGSPKSPPKTTVQEQAFSFQVPSNWFPAVFDQGTKTFVPAKDFKPGSLQAGGFLVYASPKGDYFLIEFDLGGHGIDMDIEWTGEARDDRVVVLKEGPYCRPNPESLREWCRTGDGRLDVWVGPGSLELRGHHYFIQFGNVRQEKGVDFQVFRDILASFRAK